MKEIIVQRKITGGYSSLELEEASKMLEGHGYNLVHFTVGDTVIALIFPDFFGVNDEQKKEEIYKYLEYVRSITGLEIPEEVAD